MFTYWPRLRLSSKDVYSTTCVFDMPLLKPNQQYQSAEHKNKNIRTKVVVFFYLQHEDVLFGENYAAVSVDCIDVKW